MAQNANLLHLNRPSAGQRAFRPTEIPEPRASRFLFGDRRMAWFWLIVRVYCGWEWLNAGWEKIQSPAWNGAQAGTALTGFANGALNKTGGANPDVTGWYATFLRDVVIPNAPLWGRLVSYGELLVGVGLIVGALTGVAAFFGSLMNVNYLLAGTVSSNPILFVLATWLVLAWRVAGWWGVDRWLLPALGTPWWPGRLRQAETVVERPEPAEAERRAA